MNLKIDSQTSSGKYKYVSSSTNCCEEEDLREVLFFLFIGSFGDGLGFCVRTEQGAVCTVAYYLFLLNIQESGLFVLDSIFFY